MIEFEKRKPRTILKIYCAKTDDKKNRSQAQFSGDADLEFNLVGKEIVWGYDEENDILAFKEQKYGRLIYKHRTCISCSIDKELSYKTEGKWLIQKDKDIYTCRRISEEELKDYRVAKKQSKNI